MDPVLLIFGCIALGAVTILCIAATVVLLRTRSHVERVVVSVESMQTDVAQLQQQLEPVLERTAIVLSDVQRIVENADKKLDQLSGGIETFASIAKDVKDLESMVIGKMRGPLEDITSLVAGAVRGVSAFTKKIVS
ncbi:MAG: hypothetical protein JSS89_02230 [Bacteroidetes bacterium]|nr:hypothetical protein [Bacteroidota bacterium]